MYRKLSVVLVALSAMLILAAVGLPSAGAQDANKDVYGRDLPANAAPYDQQIYRTLGNATMKQVSFSSVVTVYSRIDGADMFGDSLVNLDENLNLIPGAAEKWEASADGLSSSFHL